MGMGVCEGALGGGHAAAPRTCSMQGLKEQKTPSGRRQLAADSTTCSTGAIALNSKPYEL